MLRLQFINILRSVTAKRSISNVPVAFSRDVVKLPEKTFQEQDNRMLQQIRSTRDSTELLNMMMRTNKTEIEPEQLALALTQLFDHQRVEKQKPTLLIDHAGFANICNLLKFKAPRMDDNDLISSLKTLISLEINSDSKVIHGMLNVVKDQINDFSPNNLLFLYFLLTKMKKTPLVEALQIAIPIVFETNISLKLDHENPKQLAALLRYVTSTSFKISPKSMANILTGLTLHGNTLELNEAKSVIWSLTNLDDLDPVCERLFNNCISVVNKNFLELNFEDLETIQSKMIAKSRSRNSIVYNEEFLENCAKYVIAKDLGFASASFILKRFNRIRFVNIDLLNYMDHTIVKNHSQLSSCTISQLLSFADGFANATHKSENWEIMKSLIHENPLINSDYIKLPWLRIALDLVALDIRSDILISRIFCTDFLDRYLKSEKIGFLDYSHLLLLWQAVTLFMPEYNGPPMDQRFINDAFVATEMTPNETHLNILSHTFGGREFIQTNVTSDLGHCLDFVISFDNNENPIAMPCKVRKYDDLPKSQVKSVAVFFWGASFYAFNYPQRLRGIFDLKRRTIEALGIRAVFISTEMWKELPEVERQTYLEREIRYCLK